MIYFKKIKNFSKIRANKEEEGWFGQGLVYGNY